MSVLLICFRWSVLLNKSSPFVWLPVAIGVLFNISRTSARDATPVFGARRCNSIQAEDHNLFTLHASGAHASHFNPVYASGSPLLGVQSAPRWQERNHLKMCLFLYCNSLIKRTLEDIKLHWYSDYFCFYCSNAFIIGLKGHRKHMILGSSLSLWKYSQMTLQSKITYFVEYLNVTTIFTRRHEYITYMK